MRHRVNSTKPWHGSKRCYCMEMEDTTRSKWRMAGQSGEGQVKVEKGRSKRSNGRSKGHRSKDRSKGQRRESQSGEGQSLSALVQPCLLSSLVYFMTLRRTSNKELLFSMFQTKEDCTETCLCLGLASNYSLHVPENARSQCHKALILTWI